MASRAMLNSQSVFQSTGPHGFVVNRVNKLLLGGQEHHPDCHKPLRGTDNLQSIGRKAKRKRDRQRTTQADNE